MHCKMSFVCLLIDDRFDELMLDQVLYSQIKLFGATINKVKRILPIPSLPLFLVRLCSISRLSDSVIAVIRAWIRLEKW
ncbi:hypothetical protein L1987_24701 [Smallanthus sonchifolius]|uniref:Uncharacterized protein n=1 Tax=Smallanthus sonchifolius TaxID=185202 RepID=A0ACB9IMN5_9ASTR|nr:hypothetical protein L1987_24701 [Smallanthus sonchifolius]